MPAEGRENPLLKKGNFDAFFREKYLTKNMPPHLLQQYGEVRYESKDAPVSDGA